MLNVLGRGLSHARHENSKSKIVSFAYFQSMVTEKFSGEIQHRPKQPMFKRKIVKMIDVNGEVSYEEFLRMVSSLSRKHLLVLGIAICRR